MTRNLYEVFRSAFPADMSHPFIETDDGHIYSYHDLDQSSACFARLFSSLGLMRGDRLVAQIDKTPEAVFLYLACLRAGMIYVPLNPSYGPAELGHLMSDSDPQIVVCRPQAQKELGDLARKARIPHVLTLDEYGAGSLIDLSRNLRGDFSSSDVHSEDVAVLIYTSGTTGRPKGAMLTHQNVGAKALVQHRIWGWTPNDVLLHVMPMFHTHGLFLSMNGLFLSGSYALFLKRFDIDVVIRLLPRVTVFTGVPTMYNRLLAHPGFTAETCRNMRLFISGSAPLSEETSRIFYERTGHIILQVYGMTETNTLTSNPLSGERRMGSVGLPLPGVDVRVVRDQGCVLASDEIGMLEVRGPDLFAGYWRMAEETRAAFRMDGFLVTGDLARISRDGYVYIVGRTKDMIISGGYKVCPKEVEDVIDRIKGVVESAVVGVPHPDFGEGAIAVVKRQPDSQDLTSDIIILRVKQKLAHHKAPRRVFLVDELPRTETGKVQKIVLREQYKNVFLKST